MRYGKESASSSVTHIIDAQSGDALCGLGPPVRKLKRGDVRGWLRPTVRNPMTICPRCAAARRGNKPDDFD